MRLVELGDVNGGQCLPLPHGRWIAAAIGPDSTVDAVRIDGVTLEARSIVPVSHGAPRIEPVRGVRTGALTTSVTGRAQLRMYEAGDVLPGDAPPRARVRAAYDSSASLASLTRCIRLPWAGRRHASLHMTIAVGQTLTWKVYGVKYRPRGAAAIDPPWTFPIMDSTFTSATDAATTELDCDVQLLGGSDSIEDYDELEAWFSNAAAYRIVAQLEGWD